MELPPELVTLILDYVPRSSLPVLARVNRTWYAQANARLYEHVYIATAYHWRVFLANLRPNNAQYITSLVLRPCPPLMPSRLDPSGYIRVEAVNTDQTGLEVRLPDNGTFELDTSRKEAEWLAHAVVDLKVVLWMMPKLVYIDLTGCEQVAELPIPHPEHLRGVWVPLLRQLHDFLPTLKKAKYLRHLDLSFCSHSIPSEFDAWPNLTHLRLNSLYDITDAHIASIAKYCPQLELLHLARCWQVTNNGLRLLPPSCPNLKHVSVAYLSRANEEGIGRLALRLKHLHYLDITGCGINQLFKQAIMDVWKSERAAKQWDPVEYHDAAIFLL